VEGSVALVLAAAPLGPMQTLAALADRLAKPLAPLQQGELRCIFVESQPIDRPYFAWTIADAATGVMESGETSVRSLLPLQP